LLAQAPANTFKGVLALGFCADLDINKTLCNGTGLNSHVLKEGKSYYFDKSEKLTAPFIVLQGMDDKVCSYKECENYMKGLPQSELVSLPKVGHGFGVAKNWLPQYIASYKKVLNAPSYIAKVEADNTILKSEHLSTLPGDLPLILIPASSSNNLPMAFVISGDGGWTSFDQSLSEHLAKKGISVVGLDAQKYFWNAKTPEETTTAVAKAIQYYMQQWNKKSFVLTGYSFGACIVPFIANRFSKDLKESLKGVYSLSPDETGDFEIHIADMLSFNKTRKYNVLEELKKIKTLNPVCFFGKEEEVSVQKHFSETGVKVVLLAGNHHYNNDFGSITDNILKSLNTKN
jgi:type IV secretory pathway VirJ component